MGIPLAGVIGGKERYATEQVGLRSMRETGPLRRKRPPRLNPGFQEGIEPDPSQRDDDLEATQEANLLDEIWATGAKLCQRGPVGRWGTADGSRNVAVVEVEPVVSMERLGLVREAGGVERTKQEVPTPVAGEHSPGSVAAMGGRSETDDQN